MGRKSTFLNSHMTGLRLGLSVPKKKAAVIVWPAGALLPTCQQCNTRPTEGLQREPKGQMLERLKLFCRTILDHMCHQSAAILI